MSPVEKEASEGSIGEAGRLVVTQRNG